jgi:hypothetical protein
VLVSVCSARVYMLIGKGLSVPSSDCFSDLESNYKICEIVIVT